MKRKVGRVLKYLFVAFTFAWLYTKLFWPSTFTDAPEILANLYAKELCTCRYVVGQSLERCFENHAIITRPSSLEWNDAEKRVSVRVFWSSASARADGRYGCVRLPAG